MPSRRCKRALLVTLSLGFLAAAGIASGQGGSSSWELKVCADQDNMPYSNEAGEGFENQIVAAVATAVQARVSYVWLPRLRNQAQDLLLLRDGTCDVFLDIGNGQDPYLPTLDYYQSTYEFFYRADAGFTIGSLDDPALKSLRLGTAAASPAATAFATRDMIGNNRSYYPRPPSGVTEAMIEDVAAGVIDVGAAWGPEVAYFAAQQPVKLAVVPVTPEIDVDGLSMIYTSAMGVRSNDTELRDLLNEGISRSWDEIQAILQEFDVPVVPLPRPATSIATLQGGAVTGAAGEADETVRIGVILPMQTGQQPLGAFTPDVLGSLAYRGAIMAFEDFTGGVEAAGRQLKVLVTSAPDAAATVRATNRLVGVEGVSAIVGGLGRSVARRLSDLAEERGFVFMNIGAQDDSLRGVRCDRNTFHVEASSSMYVDALVDQVAASGASSVFVVRSDSPEDAVRFARMRSDLADRGAATSNLRSLVVKEGEPNFVPALEAARAAGADLVVMLLDAPSQLVMLGQLETSGLEVEAIGYPDVAAQTRQFYATAAFEDPMTGTGRHLALWEGTLDTSDNGDVNGRFVSRYGQAMDPPAWSAYVALKLLVEAAVATGTSDATAWIEYLVDPDTVIDVYKGDGTSFRSWDHQLRQPLYVVGTRADYSDKRAFRDVAFELGQVPTEAGQGSAAWAQELDALGVGEGESTCDLGEPGRR